MGVLELWNGQSLEKSNSAPIRASTPKWESSLERTQWEGIRAEISSGPLPFYPPTETI
jgi:hypothetical protein